MTENPSSIKAPKPFRKGSLVCVDRIVYENSLESSASDEYLPDYIFEGPGEVLIVKGDYVQVRWRRPVPDVWFQINQLKLWNE